MEVVLPWPAGQRCSLTREVPDGGLLVSPAAHESNRESRRLCCSRGAAGNYPSIRILRKAFTNIIEGSAPGHRVGVPHQRLQVARAADFLKLEQRPDAHGTLRCRMTSVAEGF